MSVRAASPGTLLDEPAVGGRVPHRGQEPDRTDALGELLAAAVLGDTDSRTEIIRRYGGLVEGTVARCWVRSADRPDAVQSTWLRFFEHAHTIRDPRAIGSWLTTTARRECLRLAGRAAWESPVGTAWDELTSSERSPEASVLEADERHTVRVAVAELGGRPAEIVEALFFQAATSYADLSERLDIPIGSIGPTRARVIRRLRSRLADVAG